MKPPKKTCSHCEETKGLEHFHKSASGKYGVHSICKPCRVAYNSPRFVEWQRKNPERYRGILQKFKRREREKAGGGR